MNSNEIYKEYLNTLSERVKLEDSVQKYIDEWIKGNLTLSEDEVNEIVKSGNKRLADLRKTEIELKNSYMELQNKENSQEGFNSDYDVNVEPISIDVKADVLSGKLTLLEATKLVNENQNIVQITDEVDLVQKR